MVRRVEFAKFVDQAVRNVERFRLVEHEVAQEGIEVAEILCRLGLVQQTQRHFVVDAKQAGKTFAVGPKFIARIGVGKRLLELADVEIGIAEIAQFTQVEVAFENEEIALDVGVRVGIAAHPEQLHQGHVLAQRILVLQSDGGPCRA
ncbi:hypothetical protein LP419_21710 [Massilia sp. H-1]|nr:hypothetical protein LP419_21710 [Massilia sp. H-1]